MKFYNSTLLSLLLLLVGFGSAVESGAAQVLGAEESAMPDSQLADPQGENSAITRNLRSTINAEESDSFEALQAQASSVARSLLIAGFAEDPAVMAVKVTIIAERYGQQIPLLLAEVSRSEWQRFAQVSQWAQFFNYPAKVLLGFVNPQYQQPSSRQTNQRASSTRSSDRNARASNPASRSGIGGRPRNSGSIAGASKDESAVYSQDNWLDEDSFGYR